MTRYWTDSMTPIRKGEIYLANLGNRMDEDIGKIRPVLIFQNDLLNRMIDEHGYHDVIIIPLSSQIVQNDFAYPIAPRDKLQKKSIILCNAIKMIHVSRLKRDVGVLTTLAEEEMVAIEKRVAGVIGCPLP